MNLECTPMHQGFKLYKNRGYFIKKANNDLYVCVVFPAPRIKVNGKLIIDQLQMELEGEGYHDHTWGSTSLVYTHKEWHWGRVFTDEFTVFFTKVFPSDDYHGKLHILYFAKTGTTEPTLEDDIEITPENWKREFMWEVPFTMKFPQGLSIKSLKNNLSLKTKYIETLIMLKVYIRMKVNASVIENSNHLSGAGWVEYLKIPSSYFFQRIMMFFLRKKYKSDKWREKQDYEHLLPPTD